jgi:hypothetical protein
MPGDITLRAGAYPKQASPSTAGLLVRGQSASVDVTTAIPPGTQLFSETFENGDFASRGWYDNTSMPVTSTDAFLGSSCMQWHWTTGNALPDGSTVAMRQLFTATDTLYISFYMKFSSDWVGSGDTYHPHLIQVLSNYDGAYDGPAVAGLCFYVETNNATPRLILQDGDFIDANNLGVDLTSITENRAVCGGNGPIPPPAYADQFLYYENSPGVYSNQCEMDATSSIPLNQWLHVEAYIQLNSVVGGVGIADGVVWCKVDDAYVISRTGVMMRTGTRSDLKLNQFIFGPYMQTGSGSPADQTIWVDELYVATGVIDTPTAWNLQWEREWDTIVEPGWAYAIYQSATVESDANAPVSPPYFVRQHYPAGMPDGNPPANFERFYSAGKYLRFRAYMRVSPDFYGQAVLSKMFYLGCGEGNNIFRLFMALHGSGDTAKYLWCHTQDTPSPGARNLSPNISAGSFSRGDWHLIEVQAKVNTVFTQPYDGEVHWWIDGVKAGEYTDVGWLHNSGERGWRVFHWAPVWGGNVGDVVPYDMYMDMDHSYCWTHE